MSRWKCPKCSSRNDESVLGCTCGYDRSHALNRRYQGCKICGGKITKPIDLYCSKCKKEIITQMKNKTNYFESSTVPDFSVNEQVDRENLGTKVLQHGPIEDDYGEESSS